MVDDDEQQASLKGHGPDALFGHGVVATMMLVLFPDGCCAAAQEQSPKSLRYVYLPTAVEHGWTMGKMSADGVRCPYLNTWMVMKFKICHSNEYYG